MKTLNYRLHTFASPGYGPLGYVEGDGVHFHRRDEYRTGRPAAFAVGSAAADLPRVDILYSYPAPTAH